MPAIANRLHIRWWSQWYEMPTWDWCKDTSTI